jgi:hypothetical protein
MFPYMSLLENKWKYKSIKKINIKSKIIFLRKNNKINPNKIFLTKYLKIQWSDKVVSHKILSCWNHLEKFKSDQNFMLSPF